MSEIIDYVKVVTIRDLSSRLSMSENYQRRSEIEPLIQSAIVDSLKIYNAEDVVDTIAMSHEIFDLLLGEKAISATLDPVAGSYFKFVPANLGAFRKKFLDADTIYKRAVRIGDRFFPDVFNAYYGRLSSDVTTGLGVEIPASDRIVSLNHNEIASLDEPIGELVDQLERDNGIPDAPGVKERLVGQIKAGRELLRVGNFRAYLFYATIIRALGELIERYKGHAIAMVAASLVDLLVKHALQVS